MEEKINGYVKYTLTLEDLQKENEILKNNIEELQERVSKLERKYMIEHGVFGL